MSDMPDGRSVSLASLFRQAAERCEPAPPPSEVEEDKRRLLDWMQNPEPAVRRNSQTTPLVAVSSARLAMADEGGGTTAAALPSLATASGPAERSSDAETRGLTAAEQGAWRTHLEVNRLLAYQLERDLQPFGLTMSDYEILVNLTESEGLRMRMSDLATATRQSKSRLSHQITRMENANLVRREERHSDRRGLYAALTDHGMETMQKVTPHYVASVRAHFIDLLPPRALADLGTVLQPIAEHLKNLRGRP